MISVWVILSSQQVTKCATVIATCFISLKGYGSLWASSNSLHVCVIRWNRVFLMSWYDRKLSSAAQFSVGFVCSRSTVCLPLRAGSVLGVPSWWLGCVHWVCPWSRMFWSQWSGILRLCIFGSEASSAPCWPNLWWILFPMCQIVFLLFSHHLILPEVLGTES